MYDCMALATPLPMPRNVSRLAKRQPAAINHKGIESILDIYSLCQVSQVAQ